MFRPAAPCVMITPIGNALTLINLRVDHCRMIRALELAHTHLTLSVMSACTLSLRAICPSSARSGLSLCKWKNRHTQPARGQLSLERLFVTVRGARQTRVFEFGTLERYGFQRTATPQAV